MLEFIESMPSWAFNAAAAALALGLVALGGLILLRIFRKLTKNLPLE